VAGAKQGAFLCTQIGTALAVAGGLTLSLLANPGLAIAQTATPTATPTAPPAQNWTVQVGADDPTGPLEIEAFGPDPLIIHVGDTVNWKWAGFHTVTFNSGKPDLGLIVPPTGPGGDFLLGPAFMPVGVTDPSKPVQYDGTQQISSGAPVSGPPDQMKFSVTFTRTGTFGYVCEIHPGMRGNIEVREASAALPETPDQAMQRGQVTLGALRGKMTNDIAAVRPTSGGAATVIAAGVGDTFGASADIFAPGNVTVPRGGTVVWYLPDPFNVHTITFSSGATPKDLIVPKPQSSGPPTLTIPADVATPQGGTSYTGQGYLNSGLLFGGSSFVATMDAPPGTYTYYCIIHGSPQGGMMGTITVTG
jgi:plastocyanin